MFHSQVGRQQFATESAATALEFRELIREERNRLQHSIDQLLKYCSDGGVRSVDRE